MQNAFWCNNSIHYPFTHTHTCMYRYTHTHTITCNITQHIYVCMPSTVPVCLDYLLSNNHVNSIIVLKLDFSDEEVLAYYISFLKTLSFKLNKHTIHFFYNEHLRDFPLYTEAIKFFNHNESMVRIAVRTLTLNVYKGEGRNSVLICTVYFSGILFLYVVYLPFIFCY